MIPPAPPVFRKLLDVLRKDNAGAVSKFLNMLNPESVTAPVEAAKPTKGWQCPKCNNVYGPHVNACENCNEASKV